jgi:hypothetical protein
MLRSRSVFPTLFAFVVIALPAGAQDATADRTRILAIVDSALAAINRNDPTALTDLVVDEGIFASVRAGDGTRHSVRTRAVERARQSRGTIVERGFRPEVRISGPVAMVWLPYDLYVNGSWSHCGVDAFTFMKTAGAWKIVTLAWSIEQPPACERHPDGPPGR